MTFIIISLKKTQISLKMIFQNLNKYAKLEAEFLQNEEILENYLNMIKKIPKKTLMS